MEKIFLSHSSKDKAYVGYIAERFGKDICVYDSMCFEAGMNNLDEIFKGLDQTDIFVLFLSDASLSSDWVAREIAEAEKRLDHNTARLSQIFPIIIDPSIDHNDPRIPDFLKKGPSSYNLRTIRRAPIAYRKIKAQLTNRILQNDLRASASYDLFYGRDKEIGSFKQRFDVDPGLKVLVATGIPGIGRRSYLVQALRDAQIIERYHEPVVISLDTMDNIEDLLVKLYEEGFGPYPFEKAIALHSMSEKIEALTSAFQDIQAFKEHVIIYDNSCLIGYRGEFRYWFQQAITAKGIRPEVTLSIASRHDIAHIYGRKNPWIFSISLTTLPYPEWNGLLRTYSKSIGAEIGPEDRAYFKDIITGYPPQVLYCADLAKEQGIGYVKDAPHEVVASIAGNVTQILEQAIPKGHTKAGYGLLSFISAYGLVPSDIIQKIFRADPEYLNLFRQFKSLTICRFIGSAQEYVEVNPVIGDYIQRRSLDLPPDIRDILSDDLRRFNTILENAPELLDVESFESIRYYLKENIKSQKAIPSRFMYSTIYLRSVFELYNSRKYDQVVEIVSALKENGAFDRYDQDIQSRIQGYYCRALVQERSETTFYTEVDFFRPGQMVEYNFLYGFMYRKLGNFAKAKERYLQVLKVSPNYRSAYRELVAVYKGLEDYESAQGYAEANYRREPENIYFIQSYFDILIRLPDGIQTYRKELEEMLDTTRRIHASNPTDIYFQINALYCTYVDEDQTRAYDFLENGQKRFSDSQYIMRSWFDCCDHFADIPGMERTLKTLKALCKEEHSSQSALDLRSVILDAYHQKPRERIDQKIDQIREITPEAKRRLKKKAHLILESTR